MLRQYKDMIGKQFGKLTVIERVTSKRGKSSVWRCRCDCGNEKNVRGTDLMHSAVISCGCEKPNPNDENYAQIRLRRIFVGMKSRCYNSKQTTYKYYGERGINICDEWMQNGVGIKKFIDWSIANGYRNDYSIDRIDSNKGYSPENCRWVDRSTQAINRRKWKNKTGERGVYWRDYGAYEVCVFVNKKRIYVGYCKTIDEAREMRKAAELKYYGQVLD